VRWLIQTHLRHWTGIARVAAGVGTCASVSQTAPSGEDAVNYQRSGGLVSRPSRLKIVRILISFRVKARHYLNEGMHRRCEQEPDPSVFNALLTAPAAGPA